MRVIIDTHVHLYPCYSLEKALGRLHRQLSQYGSDIAAACLVESGELNFFAQLSQHVADTAPTTSPALPTRLAGGECLVFENSENPPLFLFDGCQVATQERIEVLGLATDVRIPNGLTAAESIDRLLDAGALPALAWAPGKWFGARGDLVRSLLAKYSPDQLLLSDSSLRPRGWPFPRIMKEAQQEGFRVVAGSDPLPLDGDEQQMGCYVTACDGEWDGDNPRHSLRNLLCGQPPLLTGKRGGPLGTFVRLLRHELNRRHH